MRSVISMGFRRIVRLGITALLSLTALFTAGSLIPAHASTMTVNTSADDNITDGNCTLREAIRASVSRSQVDQCAAGSGNDLIVFAAGISPTIALPLPSITSGTTIAIYGGSQKTTAHINYSTGGFVFTVTSGGTLSVQNVNFTGTTSVGCFQSTGSLTLINEQITPCSLMVRALGGSVNLQGITGGPIDTRSGNASLIVSNSSFTGGIPADFFLGSGGATISHSTFTNTQNVSIASAGSLTITNTMFTGNGIGGISVTGGVTNLTNSIITQQSEGAVDNEGAVVTITNSTISGNIYGLVGTSGIIHLRNTILANTTSDCFLKGTALSSEGDNMQMRGDCPSILIVSNPLLDSSFTPGAGSVAIDNGFPALCPSTDFYGTARPKDGDGNGSAICDIGAVEK